MKINVYFNRAFEVRRRFFQYLEKFLGEFGAVLAGA